MALVSGTALAAGVAGTQRDYSFAVAIFLCIASFLFSSGCGVSNATPSVETNEVNAAPLEIDAGVIFSDRGSYLCVPLSRFGLSDSDHIETIVSSCECVQPSLIQYPNSANTTTEGVLLEFVPEEKSTEKGGEPTSLGVVLTLTMKSGEIRTATVNLFSTLAPQISVIY